MSDSLNRQLRALIEQENDSLVALRRELHQIPETGLQLPLTCARVRAEFEKLGLEITDCESVTGFVAVLRGTAKKQANPTQPANEQAAKQQPANEQYPIVLLRADMDALPVVEETPIEWKSTNGAMHACGHDMHMAGIVGAARALSAVKDQLAGDVIFFLQPGEEGWDGAQYLIDEGLLEAAGRMPDHAYGLHVWSGRFPSRAIAAKSGPLMASSDVIHVTVKGRGGHGSAPMLALDPVPVAAEIITATHTMVTREFDVFDPVVVTCGHLVAGSAPNIIPDDAHASFTLRAFSPSTRERLIQSLQRLASGICAAHGMTAEFDIERLYPVTVNDPQEMEFVRSVVDQEFPDRYQEMDSPVSAAEDFSKILERIPGAYVFVSAVPEDVDASTAAFNHSPKAFYSDDYLADCAHLLASLAAARLANPD